MQIDLDALERYSRLIVDGPHDHLPQSFVKAHENTLALVAKVRELERLSAVAYQNGMADERKASDQYAKGWNDARRATDGQRDTARGVPEGWKLLPVDATPEILQAIWSNERDAKRAWRDALAAAPTPPDGDATREGVNELWYRLRNPMTPFGMLVRTLRSLTGTLLMDMARDLQTTPAELSAYECGRKPIPPELPRYAAQFFARHGIADTLPALTAAMSASKGSDDGR